MAAVIAKWYAQLCPEIRLDLIYQVSAIAETQSCAAFDLPEAETELVGGLNIPSTAKFI